VANGARGELSFTGRVEVVEYLGNERLVHLTVRDTPVLALLPVEQRIDMGQELGLVVPEGKLLRFDADTEERMR